MPIIVKFYNDLYDDPDEGDYDYFDWLAELAPDAEARKDVRRLIFVDAMENADAKALQTVVDYIRGATDALLSAQILMSAKADNRLTEDPDF